MTEKQLKELIREEYHNVKSYMEETYGFVPELGQVVDNPYVSAFKAEDYLEEDSSLTESIRVGKVVTIKKYNPKTNRYERTDVKITDYIKKPGSKDFVEYEVKGKKRKVAIKVFRGMMESLNEESESAYLLRRMSGVGGDEADEFLSKNKVSLYKIKLGLDNKVFNKYDLRDVIQGKAAKSIEKKVMKQIKESIDDTISEELRPDEVEFIIKKLGNSMPNHTNYDYDKGPTDAQVLKALKKYHRDYFRHSTTAQKKEIVKGIQKYLTESTDEALSDYEKKGAKYDKIYKGYKYKKSKSKKNEVIEEYDVETIEETKDFINFMKEYKSDVNEADYQGRDVKLGKIMQGDVKKFKVYVKNDKGNVVKVNFGEKGAKIKKGNPERRKSFRARHNCDNPGPRWKARYWSCRKW